MSSRPFIHTVISLKIFRGALNPHDRKLHKRYIIYGLIITKNDPEKKYLARCKARFCRTQGTTS